MYGRLKRLIDVVVAGIALAAAAPVLGLAAALVRLTMGSPVLYRQTRTGLDGRPFTLLKLRTMRAPDDGDWSVAADRRRLTALGRWLRATSLDELPQLWNVLRGDMSLVGPRPLLPRYLGRYTAMQARRHEVPPGLTGLAQVSGRNGLTWAEKFALDVWYVDHRGTLLDLWILLRTVPAVLGGRGIRSAGQPTAAEFFGDEPAQRSRPQCTS